MIYQFKGARLVDRALMLIEAHGLSGTEVSRRYRVSPSWLASVRKRQPGHSPSCDIIQEIIEDLTNKPLIPR